MHSPEPGVLVAVGRRRWQGGLHQTAFWNRFWNRGDPTSAVGFDLLGRKGPRRFQAGQTEVTPDGVKVILLACALAASPAHGHDRLSNVGVGGVKLGKLGAVDDELPRNLCETRASTGAAGMRTE